MTKELFVVSEKGKRFFYLTKRAVCESNLIKYTVELINIEGESLIYGLFEKEIINEIIVNKMLEEIQHPLATKKFEVKFFIEIDELNLKSFISELSK